MADLGVIIPAAGSSSRYGGPTNKLLETLAGRAVIARSVGAFLQRSDVGQVVIPTGMEGRLRELLPPDERIHYCAGGATRADSVLMGLKAMDRCLEWVAVHDGARPLVSQPLIDHTLEAARRCGAAGPAMPVALTIKQALGPLPAEVQRTVPRQSLWTMQTPQIARRAALIRAFEQCPIPLAEATDDVQLIELAGSTVLLVTGEERNLKITTPMDLKIAELLLTAG